METVHIDPMAGDGTGLELVLEELRHLRGQLDRMEDRLEAAERRAVVVEDLLAEVMPISGEVMGSVAEALAPYEDELRLEQLQRLAVKVVRMAPRFETALSYLDATLDLAAELPPIATEAMTAITELLMTQEGQKLVHFGTMLWEVLRSTIPEWEDDEIDRLGEHMASLAYALMHMSDPEELANLEKAGLWRVFRDSRSPEVKEGMAFMTRLLYLAHPGRGRERMGRGLVKHDHGGARSATGSNRTDGGA